MKVFLMVCMLVVGFVMLIKGANWFVDGASGIAERLKIPQLVIGLTIVAMGTSAPEAAVSISSALKESADISIGNIVGSNILNVLIILGLTSVITTLKVADSTLRTELPFMIVITGLLLIFGITGNTISTLEGIIFLFLFVGYLCYLYLSAKRQRESVPPVTVIIPLWKSVLFLVLGIVLVVVGSNFAIDGASGIAKVFGVGERFIGLTIVALGTSLPELVTSLTAAGKGNADIAIGNVVGSNIFNILFILGTTALIIPVPFADNFRIDTLIAQGAGVLLLIGSIRKHCLTGKLGILMLLSYAAYFVYLL